MTDIIDITDPQAFLKLQVRELLQQVYDPELGVDIINLGLVYRIDADAGSRTIQVTMTLTSRGCPMGAMITREAATLLQDHFADWDIHIHLVWDPPWSAERISAEGRAQLGR